MDQNAHNEIMRAIGRLEGKVDGINQRLDSTNGSIKTHDDKIRSLEIDVASIKTTASILGGAAGLLITIIWSYIKDKFK